MDEREIDEIAAWLAQEKVCFIFIYYLPFLSFHLIMLSLHQYMVKLYTL